MIEHLAAQLGIEDVSWVKQYAEREPTAYDLLRMFGREGGRIAKIEHLLHVVNPVDDTYRRQMNRQLNVQESSHKLARDVCHGKHGTIHQAYRDGMEDQFGALGLVLNGIVLRTTEYVDAGALRRLRNPDAPGLDEDEEPGQD